MLIASHRAPAGPTLCDTEESWLASSCFLVQLMAASVMLCLACMVIATGAVPCHYTQHCSDCDRGTGDCLTECETGYYDRKCKSECSRNCRNNTCVLSSNANDNCTYGCIPGYQGIGCNIPCDSPEGGCTACPGGCDGGYCQLGSSCVSGCVGVRYGRDCEPGHSVRLELYVGLSAAAALSLMINLILCCKYCQRSRRNSFLLDSVPRTNENRNHVAEVEGPSGAELEWYTDIPLTSMATTRESIGRNCRGANEAAAFAVDVYDVAVGRNAGFPPVLGNIYSKLSHD